MMVITSNNPLNINGIYTEKDFSYFAFGYENMPEFRFQVLCEATQEEYIECAKEILIGFNLEDLSIKKYFYKISMD